MVVNKVMASQPMCVARLRDNAMSLYSNPRKNRVATEALNATPLPPPYKAPVEQRKSPSTVKEELPESNAATSNDASTDRKAAVDDVNINTVAAASNINITQSMNNYFEGSGWEMVHEEPIVDIFMEDIPPVAGNKSIPSVAGNKSIPSIAVNNSYLDAALHNNTNQLNGVVQHSSTASNTKPHPSLSPQSLSVESGVVRTYTPCTISSNEGTASNEDDDDDLIGSLRPKKKHRFNAPDLFKEQWKSPRKATVSC